MASPLANHNTALEQVSQWVKSEFADGRDLTSSELSESPVAGAVRGWSIPFGQDTNLHLLLDKDFPYSEPRIVVEGRPELLRGPHLETRGRLCIAGDGGHVDSMRPADVASHVYREATELLKSNEEKENDPDFQNDFRAYWLRDAKDDTSIGTLVALSGPSRKIFSWSGKSTFVGDEETLLTRFLTNLKITSTVNLKPAFAIWLESLPRPSEYPSSVHGLRRLVANNSKDGARILDELLSNPNFPLSGVLMGPAEGDDQVAGIGGLKIERREIPDRPGGQVQDPLNKGFRPGRVPPAILALRLSLKRLHVDEVDGAKSRRPAYLSSSDLSSKKVLLIGCGSLGAGVAKLLLQSGVGELTLIDPDTLGWANIGRHELGGISVGKNKAEELSGDFRLKYPLAIVTGYARTWLDVYREKSQLFEEADLIVTTCANWNAESALSDLQQSGELPTPVLYGWLEESALAAHAVVFEASSPCFRCGFNATGIPYLPVVRALNGLPAGCGGNISRYSATDMAPAQAMIAGTALDVLLGKAKAVVHRVWLCPKPNLDEAHGDWNSSWVSKYGTPPVGGTIVPCVWPKKEGCSCHS